MTFTHVFSMDLDSANTVIEGLSDILERLVQDLYAGERIERPTPSGQAFCGCGTCIAREALFYVGPRVLLAAEDGLALITEDDQ